MNQGETEALRAMLKQARPIPAAMPGPRPGATPALEALNLAKVIVEQLRAIKKDVVGLEHVMLDPDQRQGMDEIRSSLDSSLAEAEGIFAELLAALSPQQVRRAEEALVALRESAQRAREFLRS